MKKAIFILFGALLLSSCAFILPPSISEDYIDWRDSGTKDYEFSLFSNYNMIADIQGDSISKFGVGEDKDYFYFYYQFNYYRSGNYLTTVGKAVNPKGGITGKDYSTIVNPARDYGTASNAFEMVFSLRNGYMDGVNLVQNMNGQSIYLYVQSYTNLKYFINNGVINFNYGYAVYDDKNMEIMLKKSFLGLSNISLSGLAFMVGRWGSGNMDTWGVDFANFCPSGNMQETIRYYKKTDGSVVYRGGPTQGWTYYNNSSGNFLYSSLDALLQTSVGLGFYDMDNNSAVGSMVIRMNTNGIGANSGQFYYAAGYTSSIPKNPYDNYYSKEYGYVTNITGVTDGKILVMPGKRVQVFLVYSDISTGMTVSNFFIIEKSVTLTLSVSGMMNGGMLYNGRAAFPNTYNNYDWGGWQFDLQNGFFYGDIQIGESQIPFAPASSGAIVIPYGGMRLDGFSTDIPFPDCTAFMISNQGIEVQYNAGIATIGIFNK
jgi:hypothetical protein